MSFAPQRRAPSPHRNLQKWSEPLVCWTFLLGNVLRAATAWTFSTSQLPKVVRTWCVLYILTSKTLGVQTTFGGSDVASLHYTTLHYITLHYTPLHYTTLHCTTLHNTTTTTTLHYTPLHSTTLHYTPLHSTTLGYTPLHSTTLHYTKLHYTTLH